MMDSHTFRPRLEIVECEGHGRYFEVNDGGTYAGTFDTGDDVCRRYAGRIALVYGYDAYDAACAKRIAADPTGWDCSDVVPEPVLCVVRPPREAWCNHDAAAVVDGVCECGRTVCRCQS